MAYCCNYYVIHTQIHTHTHTHTYIHTERAFWTKLANVTTRESERVWLALQKGLVKYNKLLERRKTVIDDTTRLTKQVCVCMFAYMCMCMCVCIVCLLLYVCVRVCVMLIVSRMCMCMCLE